MGRAEKFNFLFSDVILEIEKVIMFIRIQTKRIKRIVTMKSIIQGTFLTRSCKSLFTSVRSLAIGWIRSFVEKKVIKKKTTAATP